MCTETKIKNLKEEADNAPKRDAEELHQFNALYHRYYSSFVNFAFLYLHEMSAAEDYTTESFMAFWDHRAKVDPHTSARAYILTVLRNKCLNHLKQRDFRSQTLHRMGKHSQWDLDMSISTLEACDPHEVFSAEVQELIGRALEKLPVRTMKIFMMSRYDNLSNRHIAENLGISVKGVEFHISKALALLRTELKDYLPALMLLHFFP